MSENLPALPPDSVAVIEIASLSPQKRVELARKAHRKHVLGTQTSKISEDMGLNEQTVVRLINEELYRANTHRPNPGHLARARMQYIIEDATAVLERGNLKDSSLARSQLLRLVLEAQDKLDRYDGNEKPKVSKNIQIDLASLAREAARQEKEGRRIVDAEIIE